MLGKHHVGNKKTRQDKEKVDTNEAATHPGEFTMEEHHQIHGNCAQPVERRTMRECLR
jgi:hypothetical protein